MNKKRGEEWDFNGVLAIGIPFQNCLFQLQLPRGNTRLYVKTDLAPMPGKRLNLLLWTPGVHS
jgi:hypothetical protein